MKTNQLIDQTEIASGSLKPWERVFIFLQIGMVAYMAWLIWQYLSGNLLSNATNPLLPTYTQILYFERSAIQLFLLCLILIVGLILKLLHLPMTASIVLIAGSIIAILVGKLA